MADDGIGNTMTVTDSNFVVGPNGGVPTITTGTTTNAYEWAPSHAVSGWAMATIQRSLHDVMLELKQRLQQDRADRELARELIEELKKFEQGDERRLG